jgi:hypothetical protein
MGNVSHRGSDVLGNTYASNSHSDSCDDSVRRGIGHSWPDDFGCLGKSPTPRTCAAQYPRIWQVLPAGIGRRDSAGARRTPPPGQPLAADGAWGRPPRPSSPAIWVVTRESSTGGMCPHSRTANSARCSPDQFPGVLERARLVVAACRTSTGMSISGRAAGDRGLLAAQHVHHGLRLQGARVVHELREDICGELAAVDRRAKACQKAGGRNAEGENRGHVHPAGGPRHRAAPPRGVGLEMARLSHAIQVLPEADLMAQSAAGTASRSLLVHLRLFPNRHLFPHLFRLSATSRGRTGRVPRLDNENVPISCPAVHAGQAAPRRRRPWRCPRLPQFVSGLVPEGGDVSPGQESLRAPGREERSLPQTAAGRAPETRND